MDADRPPPLSWETVGPPAPPPRRGHPAIAWCAIVLLAGAATSWQAFRGGALPRPGEESAAGFAADFQFRYLIGVKELLPAPPGQLYEQAQTLNSGPLWQRLRFVSLAGELKDEQAALRLLNDLAQEIADDAAADVPADAAGSANADDPATDEERSALRRLRALYGDYAAGEWSAPSLAAEDRARLEEQLGFAGRLALHPAKGPDRAGRDAVLQSARRVAAVALGGVCGFGCVALFGLAGLIVLAALVGLGRMHGGLGTAREHSGIYAETFAVWLALFLSISFVAAMIAPGSLLVGGGAMLLSLAAVGYPVARGIPWADVRRDIGWTVGRGPRELAAGVAAYAMVLPLAAVGGLVTFVLILLAGRLRGEVSAPSHPIVLQVPGADGRQIAVVLLVASVVAPLVEETVFRGVLHRHLRDATRRWGSGIGFLLSSLLGGGLFAVIHPQGLLAVPALSGVALGLAIAREWRGTLLPAMVAHGIHNGALMLLLVAVSR